MKPIDWEHSTFDEVLLVIKGKVDDWRIQRRLSHNLHCSLVKEPVSILNYCPLIFDDEIVAQEKQQEQDALEWYKMASGELQNVIWEKK